MAPARTPVRRPALSRVGTAMITTRLLALRATSPSLTNGPPVATTALKYDRSATLSGGAPLGRLLETRLTPSRSIQPRPPVNGFALLLSSRVK